MKTEDADDGDIIIACKRSFVRNCSVAVTNLQAPTRWIETLDRPQRARGEKRWMFVIEGHKSESRY